MAAAAIMMNAANIAYRKAVIQTRDKDHLLKTHPIWMTHFAERLLMNDQSAEPKRVKISTYHRKEMNLSNSEDKYERFAWHVYRFVVSQTWFEAFIMCHIVLIGVATGLDLENSGRSPLVNKFVEVSAILTTVTFTIECVLKIASEAYRPQDYFLDPKNGAFNTFDFALVVAGYALIGNSNGGAVGALRMLRLVRLLTFIKGVPQLRVIISGLIHGLKSVTYIVMLLFLVIYMFAILATLIFGSNDPARFGSVVMSSVALFQVSTLSSWTFVAYTSWYGCGNFQGDQYTAGDFESDPNPSTIHTPLGNFEGYKCDRELASPATTFFFFHIYIVLTAWVILSLFIGVISMGMFEAFQTMKAANREARYRKRLDENTSLGVEDERDGEDYIYSHEYDKDVLIGDRNGKQARRALDSFGSTRGTCLRDKIDYILEDVHEERVFTSRADKVFEDATAACLVIREHAWFNNLITVTIMVVGVVIGIDTNKTMECDRLERRVAGREDASATLEDSNCDDNLFSDVVTILSQIIFTAECTVKILAEGHHPLRYFTEKRNGSWNSLDFFVVIMGFIEMSPLSFIFDAFPVVMLRLLRLLRVFRLAKTLPRLRSIVEALMSGFSAVGWICVFIVIFNYITACMLMIFFQENDPFHFGSIGRAMFTVLRIETLDTWDQILYLSMFGCEAYPAAYPLLDESINPNVQCRHPKAFGWLAAFIFLSISIIGAYILPTVLVGIVSISFDEATRKADALVQMTKDMAKVVSEAEAALPNFFTPERLNAIRDVFEVMDADDGLTLDSNEMSPFYHYTFAKLFGVSLTKDQTEALFHLMDTDGGTELGYAEFVMFVIVVKQIEEKCKLDPEFREASFPDSVVGLQGAELEARRRETWAKAVKRIDDEALEEAWTTIFTFLGEGDDGEYIPEQLKKVKALFEAYDANGNGSLDVREVTGGLVSCGVLINDRQSKALIKSLDQNKDGEVSFSELLAMLGAVKSLRRNSIVEKKEAEALRILEHIEPEVAKKVFESRYSARLATDNTGPDLFRGPNHISTLDEDGDNGRSFEEVVEMCVGRIANRMVFESARLAIQEDQKQKAVTKEKAETSSRAKGSNEEPKIVLSVKDLESAQALKHTLTQRVLEEYSEYQSGGGKSSGSSSDGLDSAGVVKAHGDDPIVATGSSKVLVDGSRQQQQQHQQSQQKHHHASQQQKQHQQQQQQQQQRQHSENKLSPPCLPEGAPSPTPSSSSLSSASQKSFSPPTAAPQQRLSLRGEALPWSAQIAQAKQRRASDLATESTDYFWGEAGLDTTYFNTSEVLSDPILAPEDDDPLATFSAFNPSPSSRVVGSNARVSPRPKAVQAEVKWALEARRDKSKIPSPPGSPSRLKPSRGIATARGFHERAPVSASRLTANALTSPSTASTTTGTPKSKPGSAPAAARRPSGGSGKSRTPHVSQQPVRTRGGKYSSSPSSLRKERVGRDAPALLPAGSERNSTLSLPRSYSAGSGASLASRPASTVGSDAIASLRLEPIVSVTSSHGSFDSALSVHRSSRVELSQGRDGVKHETAVVSRPAHSKSRQRPAVDRGNSYSHLSRDPSLRVGRLEEVKWRVDSEGIYI